MLHGPLNYFYQPWYMNVLYLFYVYICIYSVEIIQDWQAQLLEYFQLNIYIHYVYSYRFNNGMTSRPISGNVVMVHSAHIIEERSFGILPTDSAKVFKQQLTQDRSVVKYPNLLSNARRVTVITNLPRN